MSIFVHELNIQKMYTVTLLEFLNMGGGEIMLIMVVVLLLFGGKKLPELARGLGKGIREFKDASEGVKREIHRNINSVDIVDDVKSTFNTDTTTPAQTSSLHEQMYGTAAQPEEVAAVKEVTPEPADTHAQPIQLEKKSI